MGGPAADFPGQSQKAPDLPGPVIVHRRNPQQPVDAVIRQQLAAVDAALLAKGGDGATLQEGIESRFPTPTRQAKAEDQIPFGQAGPVKAKT